jgi:hypothetical protein
VGRRPISKKDPFGTKSSDIVELPLPWEAKIKPWLRSGSTFTNTHNTEGSICLKPVEGGLKIKDPKRKVTRKVKLWSVVCGTICKCESYPPFDAICKMGFGHCHIACGASQFGYAVRIHENQKDALCENYGFAPDVDCRAFQYHLEYIYSSHLTYGQEIHLVNTKLEMILVCKKQQNSSNVILVPGHTCACGIASNADIDSYLQSARHPKPGHPKLGPPVKKKP